MIKPAKYTNAFVKSAVRVYLGRDDLVRPGRFDDLDREGVVKSVARIDFNYDENNCVIGMEVYEDHTYRVNTSMCAHSPEQIGAYHRAALVIRQLGLKER